MSSGCPPKKVNRELFPHVYGYDPVAGLIFDAAGHLYGTTYEGGAFRSGTVFELAPNPDGGWKEKVLHSFTGHDDGAGPAAALIFDQAGNLYGTKSRPD